MAATIPTMKPFIKVFNTGYLGHSLEQAQGATGYWKTYGDGSYRNGGSYGLQSMSSNKGAVSNVGKLEKDSGPPNPDVGETINVVESDRQLGDEGYTTSNASDTMIIRHTMDFNVRYSSEDDLEQAVRS